MPASLLDGDGCSVDLNTYDDEHYAGSPAAGSACWQLSQGEDQIWDVFYGMLKKNMIKPFAGPIVVVDPQPSPVAGINAHFTRLFKALRNVCPMVFPISFI